MSRIHDEGRSGSGGAELADGGGTPAKRTRTERLARAAKPGLPADVSPGVADQVDAAGSAGAALPAGPRATFEASLGADLGAVRVHTGAASETAADAVGARAFAVGNDIHFGAGQFAPEDPFGLHLLAHEVAHTQQPSAGSAAQRSALEVTSTDDPAEREADHAADAMVAGRPTSVSTPAAAAVARAPKATTSPQEDMSKELHDETTRLANAQKLLAWIRGKQPAPSAGAATPFEFSTTDVFADPVAKTLQPKPTAAADLQSPLDLLVHKGVLVAKGPGGFAVVLGPTGLIDSTAFDTNTTQVDKFTKDFDGRVARKEATVVTDQMDKAWSSDKNQMATEATAQAKVDAVEHERSLFVAIHVDGKSIITGVASQTFAQVFDPTTSTMFAELQMDGGKTKRIALDALDRVEPVKGSSHPEVTKHWAALDKKQAGLEKDLKTKQAYRTFSTEVLVVLERLRTRNTAWNAGTYPAHAWGEFSIDVFPTDWSEKALLKFFDDLDAACDDDSTIKPFYGKFAWRALFNPPNIIAKANQKHGANRVVHVDGHDDHIHLDIKPLKLIKDHVTGYGTDGNGDLYVH